MEGEKNRENQNSQLNNDVPADKRISRRALIGTIILPFGFLLALFLIPLSASTTPTPPSTWQITLRYTLLPLSIIAPFAATTLGLLGISEIRNSNGTIYGLPLAVLVSLFYPVILITAILFVVGWLLFGNIQGWDFIPVVWLFLMLVIDYFIIRAVWRVATRE